MFVVSTSAWESVCGVDTTTVCNRALTIRITPTMAMLPLSGGGVCTALTRDDESARTGPIRVEHRGTAPN